MTQKQSQGSPQNTRQNKKILWVSFFLITFYMVIEVVGGYVTNSLALLADAGHMLSDSISLGIALLAVTFGAKSADIRHTFGYKRFEILAAVVNGITLLFVSIYIIYEAILRIQHPPQVQSLQMIVIATVGLFVNLWVAWMMRSGKDHKQNLNMRSAYLHVLSDLLGSIGAIIAGICMYYFQWGWADAFASIIVALLILRSGYKVTLSSVHILMEGTPEQVDSIQMEIDLLDHPSVIEIHELHIWTITSGDHALTCHVTIDEGLTIKDSEKIRDELENIIARYDIENITIQFESSKPANMYQ
jgi:cobalt-zinc-cadmium efflux system protein